MRFLTWNIRLGGIGADRAEYDPSASEKNVRLVAKSLLSKDADVVVLTEYRDAPGTGGVIKEMLESGGYQSYASNPGLDKNGVLIAFGEQAREHYDVHVVDHFKIDREVLDEIYYYRWLDLRLVSIRGGPGIEVLGIHIPSAKGSPEENRELFERTLGYKKMFWESLISYAKEIMARNENAIILGDLNTGINSEDNAHGSPEFHLSECMQKFKGLKDAEGRGCVDSWRRFHGKSSHVDYTWFSPEGEGYRLDYAFLSPALGGSLKGARYSDEERKKGISDHSMLIIEINI